MLELGPLPTKRTGHVGERGKSPPVDDASAALQCNFCRYVDVPDDDRGIWETKFTVLRRA